MLEYGDALAVMLNVALETAMRRRETCTLSRNQVDLIKRTIFLGKTKNGDKRQVPISSMLLKVIKGYFSQHEFKDDELIFPWWDGNEMHMDKTTSILSRQWGRVYKRASVKDLSIMI